MRKFGFVLLALTALILAGGTARAEMTDDQGDAKKFSIHGEVRFRAEMWNNMTDFTDTGTDCGLFSCDDNDSFDIWPYRVRLAAKGDLGNDIYVYGEFQGSGVSGGGVFGETQPNFGDDTETITGGVHLYQGWVKAKDIGNTVLDLKFGRQEIVFGTGLHFSSLDFYNGIHHDAVMGTWDWENFRLDGFYIKNFESNQILTFQDVAADSDDQTLGVHAQQKLGADKNQDLSYYGFLQMQNDPEIDPGQDRGKIYTVGVRWAKMVHGETGFLWNAELATQFGDFQPCASTSSLVTTLFGPSAGCEDDAWSQSSYVFEGTFGYNWHSGKTDQKVWGGVTYASGDDDPTDEDNNAYMPLYTDFHKRLGYADLFAESNITAFSVGYKMNMDDRHMFGATLYQFTKTEKEGAVYSPLGIQNGPSSFPVIDGCLSTTPPAGKSCSDDLGMELDLSYGYNMTANFGFDVALSLFDPGDAVTDHFSNWQTGFLENAGDDMATRLTAQARARW